ncbi:MAG: site-specific integrase [Prevotella sp.]|nr:site-specific integrase [Prevotella sp.]MCM1074966.1 site-specific integrase [Ruminococcus sp.]
MAKIESRKKQNPKLMQSELSDGRASLYLEYYLGRTETPVLDDEGNQVFYTEGAMAGKPKYKIKHTRKKENLNLYVWLHPRSQQERVQNRNTLTLAEKLRFEREQEFLEDREGYRLKKDKQQDFHQFCKEIMTSPSKAETARIGMDKVYKKFVRFLKESPKYKRYEKSLLMPQLTPELVGAFVEYLKANGTGDGPKGYFRWFKHMVNAAVEKELLRKNPCAGFSIKYDNMALQKDILTPEEIQTLGSTHYEGEHREVQRAFMFGLFTGVRWCDTQALTYRNVDLSTKTIRFQQQKTKGHSGLSGVVIPLSDSLIALIGKPSNGNMDSRIFDLPSFTCCTHHLKRWVKEAKINKKITWHCCRHSFAVNVLSKGANIKTVSNLLGHTSVRMTERYLRVIDSLKQDAINSLGDINFTPAP